MKSRHLVTFSDKTGYCIGILRLSNCDKGAFREPSSRPARLFCVGNSGDHLETRCAVLGSAGYDARPAALPEAESLLRTSNFDFQLLEEGPAQAKAGAMVPCRGSLLPDRGGAALRKISKKVTYPRRLHKLGRFKGPL